MRRLAASTLVIFAALACLTGCRHLGTPPVRADGHVIDASMTTTDGRERTYRLFVPNELPTSVPLLVGLHGGIGSGTQFEENSNFDALAAANQFIVAYPDGVGVADTDIAKTWNGGYCCGNASKNDVDDVGFVSALIDSVSTQYPIDSKAVFAAGHSNGGIMAYRLACQLSDKIAAVGVQSGSLGVENCAPSVPVSLIHIHGTADRNHPIQGGVGDKGVSGGQFHAALDGAVTLAAADECPQARRSVDPSNPDLKITLWSPCADASAIEFVAVEGASHAWMGHQSPIPAMVGDSYLKYDSSAAMWDFLWSHRRQ